VFFVFFRFFGKIAGAAAISGSQALGFLLLWNNFPESVRFSVVFF
jgi:hypothetical protein